MKLLRYPPILLVFLIFWVSTAQAKLTPNERLSTIQIGMAYLDQWDVANARKILEQLLRESPDDTLVQYFKAQVLFNEGDYKGALSTIQAFPTTPVLRDAPDFIKLVKATVEATRNMVRFDTPHFAIFYVAGKDDILIPYAADALEKAYVNVGNDLQYRAPEKIRVEIYPDSDSFIAVTTLTKQEIETSGTIALCKFNRLMVTTPRVLARGYAYLDTLTHEYIHFTLSRKTNNQVPLWLQEGIAKFEEIRWRTNEIAALSPTSQSLLAEALEQDYFITLQQMYPSLAKLKRAEDTQLAFAQVETMVGMLVRKGGYPMLLTLIDGLSKGKSDEEALRAAGGWANMNVFLTEWKAYLRERGLKRIPGLTILKTELKDQGGSTSDEGDLQDAKKADLSKKGVAKNNEAELKLTRDYLKLGDRLRDNRRFPAAVFEYKKAKDNSPSFNPILMHKLGLAQMLAGDLDGAETTFHEALEVYPQFGPVNRRLGEVYVSKKEYAKAVGPLEMANGINPFDPSVHALLLEAYRRQGQTKLVEREEQVLGILKGMP